MKDRLPQRAGEAATEQVGDWYDEPLYYEIAFQSLTEQEATFVDAIYGRYAVTSGRRVLEPACGSGRLLEALARRGYRLTGFDRSESMLRYARDRLGKYHRQVTIVRGELASFDVEGRYDLAVCSVNSFRYLLSESKARSHLLSVARALAPGGIYILGLHLTDYGDRSRATERWHGRRGSVEVECAVTSWPPDRRRRRERVRSRLIVRDRGRELRRRTDWSFRTYSRQQLRGLLAGVGAFRHLATFGFDYDATRPIVLGAERLDAVLVLERRQRTPTFA